MFGFKFARLGVCFGLLAVAAGCQLSATAQNADGVRQFQRGEYQAALDRFQRAIATNPDNADAYYNMAATLHDWGRRTQNNQLLDQAESVYHQCLDLSPEHVDCYRALAVLLVDTNRKEKAFTLLERWAERSPQTSHPKVELARLYEEFGDSSVAKQYLTQALDVDSRSPRAWAALGQLREKEGRLEQALTNYQHAYNLNRSQPGVGQKIASLQQRVGAVAQVRTPSPLPRDSETRLSQAPSDWVPR